MSFSGEVKKELCSLINEKDCCRRAEAYGMLFFGKYFDKNSMGILSDYEFIAKKYAEEVYNLTGFRPEVGRTGKGSYKVRIKNRDEIRLILNELGYSGNEAVLKFQKNNVENDCCVRSFLRGAFISCGIVADPEKSFHFEFSASSKVKSDALIKMLESLKKSLDGQISEPLVSSRGGVRLVYYKKKNDIENILIAMGCQNAALEFIDNEIIKVVKNNANRAANCDAANIKRTIEASKKQTKAINILKRKGKFDTLPEEYKRTAEIRLERPEASLSEIGKSLEKQVSPATVSYRLNKIVELSEK